MYLFVWDTVIVRGERQKEMSFICCCTPQMDKARSVGVRRESEIHKERKERKIAEISHVLIHSSK